MQDCLSSSSDIDVMSSDHNGVILDDDECDIDVVASSTPDLSTDDTGEDVKKTFRSKRRKQLLTERAMHAEFSEVSLYVLLPSNVMIVICLCDILHTYIVTV